MSLHVNIKNIVLLMSVLSTTEYTLNMKTIEACLEDNVALHMWQTLDTELNVPPRQINEKSPTLPGVKLWLLTEPSASWQNFAMALYSATLDNALRKLKAMNLLSSKGVDCYYMNISIHRLYIVLYIVLFYFQMTNSLFQRS